MSKLLEHARRELALANLPATDKDVSASDAMAQMIADDVLELIETLAKQGHSGGSVRVCLDLFNTLACYEPLSPLTGAPEEWHEVDLDTRLLQNIRCSRVFKEVATGRAYDIHGIIFKDKDGCCYAGEGSAVEVTFPYTPVTKIVNREGVSNGAHDVGP